VEEAKDKGLMRGRDMSEMLAALIYIVAREESSPRTLDEISDITGVDATDTESTMFQCVDPDALDALFSPINDEMPRTSGHVSFSTWGYEVTVYSTGQIVITPPQQHVG
jgi:transcription initiation factor TFIIIB Brf1 subunit/transcription initiation factor TFIIB